MFPLLSLLLGPSSIILQLTTIFPSASLSSQQTINPHFLDNLFVAGTYASILASIAAPALARANIQLSTKVTHITESPETSTVIVTTSTGKQLAFDEVVMTTPLGWLKRNTDAFSPPLPDRLLSAISSLGWGNLEKVFAIFRQLVGETRN